MVSKTLISSSVPVANPKDDVLKILSFMSDEKISHIPLVENGKYLGLLNENMLLDVYEPENSILEAKLSPPLLYTFEETHFFDLLGFFSANKLSIVPVVNKNEDYLGSVKLTDLVNQIVSVGSFQEPGSIIVLRLEPLNYSLSEISRIVESNDAKILSLFITSPKDSTNLELTIKINRLDNRAVIQTFNRYQYEIVASYQKAEYNDPVMDRYESLMRYLNT